MISATDFAKQPSVWRELAPMLDHVARWLNSQQGSVGGWVQPVSLPPRHSLIAETAFRLAAGGFVTTSSELSALEDSVQEYLLKLPRGSAAVSRLTDREWGEVEGLASNIRVFVERYSSVEFSPAVPGCGVVDGCNADIVADDMIVEVKAVLRPFRVSDLRQTLTYSALLHAVDARPKSVGLLNPRRGRAVTVALDVVAAGASGLGAVELMESLVDAMTGLQISG